MEKRYKHQAWMQEGMYVLGLKPKSFGEGVVPVATTISYETAWEFWNGDPRDDLAIFKWTNGGLAWVGAKRQDKHGKTIYVPIPPRHLGIA